MKKLIPILLLFCIPVLKALSQPAHAVIPLEHFNGDTLAYVKANFVQNKDRYLHKPLSVLLTDLGVPVVSYFPGGQFIDPAHFSDIMVSFYPRGELHRRIAKHQKPLIIRLAFDSSMNRDSAMTVYKLGHGDWEDADRRFYEDRSISDIQVGAPPTPKGGTHFPKVDSAGNIETH
jgi:hypothetical protein